MRPTRNYKIPAPPPGTAKVHVLSANWGVVRVNEKHSYAVPYFSIPVEAGEIKLEFQSTEGQRTVKTITTTTNTELMINF